MSELGKTLLILGSILLVLGIFFTFFNKIPLLGKLPGDIYIKRDGFSFYAPIATSLLLSILFSVLFHLFTRK